MACLSGVGRVLKNTGLARAVRRRRFEGGAAVVQPERARVQGPQRSVATRADYRYAGFIWPGSLWHAV